jgi:hypothetical protein
MFEEGLRKNHGPMPSAEERDWLQGNFYPLLARVILTIVYAVVIGVSTSVILDRQDAIPSAAVSTPAG